MNELSSLVGEYGLAVVFANVLAEQVGLPIPAIPTLVVAGALAASGKLSVAAVFAVALLACLVADVAWYLAGRRYGNRVMRMLCAISLTPDSCVNETQSQFERWGLNALLIAKFVPGISLLAPPLAGAAGIGWPAFLAFNGAGAALWVAAGMGGGMLLGSQIEGLLALVMTYGVDALVVLGLLVLGYVAFKWRERHRFHAQLRMARIDVDELYRRLDAADAPIVVDVRSPTARKLEPRHIPGALHLPLQGFSAHVGELPRDREIVLYCSCPNEASAAQVAKLLIGAGFARVRPLLGGLEAWIAAGHPVDSLREAAVDPGVRASPNPRSA
ncbi:MAG TPA: DedA family protein/thiosulfate sulfurtransferase GlpE [Casimicrobiaceae bacterium]|nr:DedA family protein/thiosulfate sulfurtransferase GlpE [Casimicrobiaceae bacterium]